jgi:hypothetical protein
LRRRSARDENGHERQQGATASRAYDSHGVFLCNHIRLTEQLGVNFRKSYRLACTAVKQQRTEHAAGDREGVKS